jgi:tRNA-2-methylthio-N6-dimethylallyladenosine synthase
MNERDSEIILSLLALRGYEKVENEAEADVILFNTCSVRQHAEDRVAGGLQKLLSLKKKKPGVRIGVVGCMAERHGDMLLKLYPHLDIVSGPNNIYDIPELLDRAMMSERVVATGNKKRPRKDASMGHKKGVLTAFVNIMYGCDNFCSYCIVPHVRGREVSRKKKEILEEIWALANNGCKEVTLLGQNVNSYGKTLNSKTTFPDLLEAVAKVRGIERIRFVTSHPKDAGMPLFRAMRDIDKVCGNLHLPIQSASDKILDLMNRKYRYADYLKKVEGLRKILPDAGLSTDIIVGFPSEKERDHLATKKALEEVSFNSAFIFKYSPRPPAMSACLEDDVPEEEKKRRNAELLAVQRNVSLRNNKELIGSIVEVLAEGESRMSREELVGRAGNNVSCVFPAPVSFVGNIVKLRVCGASPNTLKCEIQDEKTGTPVFPEKLQERFKEK